ncbi:MAG: accessory Sec system glycosyltransferase GtfA [Candidatus Weimeria sp.]
MVVNFNLGIGWASSGVEYAQAYRARIFRKLGIPSRFVFTDMFPQENIEHFTANLGFSDDQIIWLYTFFTDVKTAPVSYTLEDFLKTIDTSGAELKRKGRTGWLDFPDQQKFLTLYFVDEKSERLHRVEYVSRGYLIRKDYFTYTKIYSEYYAPLNGKAHLYLRRFFNTDGTTAYEEITDDNDVMYRFPDHFCYSKEELTGYMVRSMNLTSDDTVIIDRTTGIGQAILQNCGDARVGIVVHAEHYSPSGTTDEHILWNNFYEYSFDMYRHISFFITSTDAQRDLMRKQFIKYVGEAPEIVTVPVGSLGELRYPEKSRRPFSVVTASRLASEKHLDWVIEAVIRAREEIPSINLDIYGKGVCESALRSQIKREKADSYVRLMGQHDMTGVYKDYELYLSGSTSEGFGLSLMEAVGSGLPIVGFDVPYGNPEFIDDGKNGYLIPVNDEMSDQEHIEALKNGIVRYFREADRDSFHRRSYQKAKAYLTEQVMQKWKEVIGG